MLAACGNPWLKVVRRRAVTEKESSGKILKILGELRKFAFSRYHIYWSLHPRLLAILGDPRPPRLGGHESKALVSPERNKVKEKTKNKTKTWKETKPKL